MVKPNFKSVLARLECETGVIRLLLSLISLAALNVQSVRADETHIESLVQMVISTNRLGGEMVAVRKLVADTNNTTISVASFVTALRSDDREVRRMAAWALWWFGTNAAPAFESLTNLLANRYGLEDTESRWQYVRAIGAIGYLATDALPQLADIFASTNEPTPLRLDARQSIVSVDTRRTLRPFLWKMWKDRHQADGWRRAAFEVFQGTNDLGADILKSLCTTLQDMTETKGVRDVAAEMLLRGATNALQRYRGNQVSLLDAKNSVENVVSAFVNADRPVPEEIDRVHAVLRDAARMRFVYLGIALLIAVAVLAICYFVSRRRVFKRARKALCVIESRTESNQGTGFWLKGVGLVTCDHVVSPDSLAFQTDLPGRTSLVTPIRRDQNTDIALIASALKPPVQLEVEKSKPSVQERVFVLGFPKFAPGASGTFLSARIVGERLKFQKRRYIIDQPIVVGSSGGPVLNARGKVIGIADCGIKAWDEVGDAESTFIPIEEVIRLSREVE